MDGANLPLSALRRIVIERLWKLPPDMRRKYSAAHLLDAIRLESSPEVYDDLLHANALKRSTLEAAIETALAEHHLYVQSGGTLGAKKRRKRARSTAHRSKGRHRSGGP